MATKGWQDEVEALWKNYQAAEQQQEPRDERLATLDRFIEAFVQGVKDQRERWVQDLCSRYETDATASSVRTPFFRRVLFPVLFDGLKEGKPNCARWLSMFSQLLYRNSDLFQLTGHQTEWQLLERAIGVDPSDVRAKERLVTVMADHFSYTLHELPAGVLYDANGADVPKCDELLADLARFEQLAKDISSLERHSKLISRCRQHYVWYKDYLQHRASYSGYKDYLTRHGQQTDD